MTVCKIFYLLALWLNVSTALEYVEMNCNFSKYILNYFKHNEKYLLHLEENKTLITIDDLEKYGTAVQSHGEIVLAMLAALHFSQRPDDYPVELMDVNLYLNNVSGSLVMVAKNDNGVFERSNRVLNVLNGFLMIHKAIVKRLENFVNDGCADVGFDQVFTNCPDFNEHGDYSVANLPEMAEKLTTRLSVNDLRFKSEWLKLRQSEVFNMLELALENDCRLDFHPRRLLCYDLMMGQRKIDERNLLSGVQYRAHSIVKDHRALNVLDYFKFAPLQHKCADDTYLTLYDVFRYMKYNFDSRQMQGYQELVLASTIRPILLLVRMYVTYLRKFDTFYNSVYYKNSVNPIRDHLSKMGRAIIKQIQRLLHMNLYETQPETYLKKLCNDMSIVVETKDARSLDIMVKHVLTSTRNFFDKNKLHNYFGTVADLKIQHENVNQIHTEFVRLVDDMTRYLDALDNCKESLAAVNKTRKINSLIYKHKDKDIFNPRSAMMNRLCSQNLYSEIYNMESPESGDEEKTNVDTISEENGHDKKPKNNQIARQSVEEDSSEQNISLPKYMIDYILFV